MDQLLGSIFSSSVTVAAAFLLSAQLHPVLSANERTSVKGANANAPI